MPFSATIRDPGRASAALRSRGGRPVRQRDELLLAKRREIDLAGIVMHQKRPIGRHGLAHGPGQVRRRAPVEREHALIGGGRRYGG